MKKLIILFLLFLALSAGAYAKILPAVPAMAADEPVPANLRWDADEYGKAVWDAVSGAAAYKAKLYKQDAAAPSGYVPVGDEIDCGAAAAFSLLSGIRLEGVGTYTFTVCATVGGVTGTHTAVDFGNHSLVYAKLDKPANPKWDWDTNEVVKASWNAVTGAEHYWVQLYRKATESGSASKLGGVIDCGTNTSCSVFDVIRNAGSGYYSFTVRATSSSSQDSDWTDIADVDSLKYPIKLATPADVRWSHYDVAGEYGVARWDRVPNATGYKVQFYQVLSHWSDKLDASGNKIIDPLTKKPIQEFKYYYYEAMGTPITLSDTATDKASNYCKVDNLVKGSGTFMFSVQAIGSSSFLSSDPSAFLTRTITTNADGRYELAPESDVIGNLCFKYIAPTNIYIDADCNGVADENQNNTIYLALGQKKTVRVIVEPENATPTGFVWNNSKNTAAFDYFTANGNELTMSACNKGRLEIAVSPKMSSLTKSIFITASEPPVKIVVSGKNSYTTSDSGELYLDIYPRTAYSSPEYIDWTSSNSNVATVSGGKVTTTKALSGGSSIEYATITARSKLDNRIEGTFRIAVSNTQILPSRIVITGNNQVALKSKLQLTANVYAGEPSSENELYAYNKEVIWSTQNEKIATVDANGLVTPKAVGKVRITAVSKADVINKVSAFIDINVLPEEINITKLSLSGTGTVKVGETISLKATITPTNATDRTLVWSCGSCAELGYSDELSRSLTGTSEGECVVTVYVQSAPSIKATLKVKVTSASDKPSTEKGETQVITNVKPTAGTGDKKNEYTAAIKDEVLNEAIGKAFREAIPLKTIPVVTIKVETPAAAADMIIKLPYSSIGRIFYYYGYSDKGVIEVETGISTIRLPAAALRSIYNQAYSNSDIQIKMSRTVNSDLNELQQQAIGKRSVIELTISSAGKEISTFGSHPITVSIPFPLSSTQSGKGAQVDNLNSSGQLLPMSTSYNYKTKCVFFDTYHLSFYSPYYYAAVAWSNPYKDVKNSDWFYDSVFYVVDKALMRGVSSDRFVPASYTTRGMVVTILHRLAGTPAPTSKNSFKDVKADQWYTDAVLWATENELVSGYGGGYFGPEDKVTREQLGVMLHNYAKYVDITPKYGWDTPMRYPDSNKVSKWARQGAMYCQITGIISGRPGGDFAPQGTATRSELSTMLLRMNNQMQQQLETQNK